VTALNRIFRIGLGLKGADGVLELVGGVLLLVVSPSQISSAARLLTWREYQAHRALSAHRGA